MSATPELSVVVATYDRLALLERLLRQLAAQSLPRHHYEVVVVDDGSREPVAPRAAQWGLPLELRVETQPNAGAAAARHRGASRARGAILVFLDDDMQVEPGFLAAHLAHHDEGGRRVVLGRIRPGASAAGMPLFERWHAAMLDRLAADVAAGRIAPSGLHLYTGNVSLARADYLAVGGFDPELAHAEDSELGLRLEEAGVRFELAEDVWSLHESDHQSLERWRRRSYLYGVYNHRLSRKHPGRRDANPWGALLERHPLTRPFLLAAAIAPGVARYLAGALWHLASGLDAAGAERAALASTSVVFGIDFFRGLRAEVGSLGTASRELARFVAGRSTA